MKARRVLLASAVLLAGCSSIQVVTRHDPDADFATYRTYCWVEAPPESDRPKDLIRADRRIRELVDRALAKKGFTRRDAVPADLVVSHRLSAKRQRLMDTDVNQWPSGTTDVLQAEVTLGKLVLAFVDPKRKQTVWRSEASDVIDEVGRGQRELDEAVAKMMAEFPPGRK